MRGEVAVVIWLGCWIEKQSQKIPSYCWLGATLQEGKCQISADWAFNHFLIGTQSLANIQFQPPMEEKVVYLDYLVRCPWFLTVLSAFCLAFSHNSTTWLSEERTMPVWIHNVSCSHLKCPPFTWLLVQLTCMVLVLRSSSSNRLTEQWLQLYLAF